MVRSDDFLTGPETNFRSLVTTSPRFAQFLFCEKRERKEFSVCPHRLKSHHNSIRFLFLAMLDDESNIGENRIGERRKSLSMTDPCADFTCCRGKVKADRREVFGQQWSRVAWPSWVIRSQSEESRI